MIGGTLPGGSGAGRGDNPHGVASGKPRGSFGTSNPNAPVGPFAPNVMAFSAQTRNAPAPTKEEVAENTALGKTSPVSNSSQTGYRVPEGSMGSLKSSYKTLRKENPELGPDWARATALVKVGGGQGTINRVQDAYGNATDARYTQNSNF